MRQENEKHERTTRYMQTGVIVVALRVATPAFASRQALQFYYNWTGMKPAIGYYSYTNRYANIKIKK